jgi:hypothetical protein
MKAVGTLPNSGSSCKSRMITDEHGAAIVIRIERGS